METNYEEIIGAALSLPPGARAMLAEHLLESLDTPQQKQIDRLWVAEAERRVQEIEDGSVSAIPAEQIFDELGARIKH